MRKTTLVGVCLLFGLLVGLTLRPDHGTEVNISPVGVAAAAGVSHAKPVPRPPTPVDDLLVDLVALSVAAVGALVLTTSMPAVRRRDEVPGLRSMVLARAGTRRGPPVL